MKHISDLKQITVIVVISLGRFVVVLKIWYFVFMSNSTHQMMIKSNELFFENVYQNITWMACSAASLLRYTYFSCVILSYILWALLNHITKCIVLLHQYPQCIRAHKHAHTHTFRLKSQTISEVPKWHFYRCVNEWVCAMGACLKCLYWFVLICDCVENKEKTTKHAF